MSKQDFLIELGTEELPPKALASLSKAFADGILNGLKESGLAFAGSEMFASPRRMAVLIRELETAQKDQSVERKGPALQAAFDAEGKPTRAAEGFARSNGVTVDQLEKLESGKGAWLVFRSVREGQQTAALLPGLVEQSLAKLPIPKRMRWGNRRDEFVRPVKWLVMLQGSEVIPCNIMGLEAGRTTRGHRIHCSEDLTIDSPVQYAELLREKGYVIADQSQRKQVIRDQLAAMEAEISGNIIIDEDLLNEVSALVEWPVALAGKFDEAFLEVPAESLISSMKEHQKYFHAVDAEGKLLPRFITIANIESTDPQQVISGNEKVISPRLADARFFFETDKKTTLDAQRERLKSVVFQNKLGTVYDKTERMAALAAAIAEQLNSDAEMAARAATLSKADLVSEMVLEFPELQGIMGQYYARHEGAAEDVAQAQNEQYMPRFAGDQLPTTMTGCAVALADKLDTLVGIFGIKQPPSGSKDPFALRRATLGILRILVEKKLNLDLEQLVRIAYKGYIDSGVELPAAEEELVQQVVDFMLDRFRASYQDQGIPAEVFLAVRALRPTSALDFDARVNAVDNFRTLAEADALAAANKRVANILAKSDKPADAEVNTGLLQEAAEKALAEAISVRVAEVQPLLATHDYRQVLESLTALKEPVDTFFDDVMVNADDLAVRANRLALLQQLRNLFLQVADISLLQKA
ncbi:glycine--tRNA ligase subunit beta [Spongorhabdus nitratireducens]